MSPQQFSLRWNNHTNNLVQVFADQYEREQHVDVTISCQGRFLKAHKIVLGACSPYFQELFDTHERTTHPIIIMNGYSFEDVRNIVEFMYRGEVMVAENDMTRLLAAAEDLQIKGLSNVRAKEHENPEPNDTPETTTKETTSFERRRKRARTTSYDTETKRKLRSKPDDVASSSSVESKTGAMEEQMTIEPQIDVETKIEDSVEDGGDGGNDTISPIKPESMEPKEKIPRPPNSFMIFANEWRRQLASQFPNESNKEISVRLGLMWKNLTDEVKAKYFNAARRANDDHKKKYPDYHYNPKEARMRKMWKMQQQSIGHLVTTNH